MEERVVDYSRAIDMMLNHSRMVMEDNSEYAYIHKSIEKIARWYVQCNQAEVPEEGYVEALRVVRIMKGIPKYALSSFQAVQSDDAEEFARTFLSGMYMVVKCIHISKEMVERMIKGHGKLYYYELPAELKRDYQESTLRFNNDGSAICLKKSDLTDWIYQGSHYKMLEVNDI